MTKEELDVRNKKIEHENDCKAAFYDKIVQQFVLKQHIKSMYHEGYSIKDISVFLRIEESFIEKVLNE